MKVWANAGGGRRAAAPYPYRHHLPGGRGAPGVTDVVDDLGLRSDYSMVPPDVLRLAGERGDRVHGEIAARLGGGQHPETLPEDGPYLEAFEAWRDVARPEVLAVEVKFLVPGAYPYGGTSDLVCRIAGEVWVVDWKCRPGFPGDGMQTAAYRRGLATTRPELRQLLRGANRAAVELRRTGGYKLHRHDDELDERRFVAALVTWHTKMSNGMLTKER